MNFTEVPPIFGDPVEGDHTRDRRRVGPVQLVEHAFYISLRETSGQGGVHVQLQVQGATGRAEITTIDLGQDATVYYKVSDIPGEEAWAYLELDPVEWRIYQYP